MYNISYTDDYVISPQISDNVNVPVQCKLPIFMISHSKTIF